MKLLLSLFLLAGCAQFRDEELNAAKPEMVMATKTPAISWAGYDESRHSNGWAERVGDEILVYFDPNSVGESLPGPVGYGKSNPAYAMILDAVGGFDDAKRKRLRTFWRTYHYNDDGSFAFDLPPSDIVESSEVSQTGKTSHFNSSSKGYNCYKKFLGFRKTNTTNYIYLHQMDEIDKCIEGLGLRVGDHTPWTQYTISSLSEKR